MRMSKCASSAAAWAIVLCGSLIGPAVGVAQLSSGSDLFALSLEQLSRVEVSSVSRHDQPLFDTPAAVFVITRDDIRRSGATSIPEVLRMVPGVQVAQIDANKWAVSARGFNNRFANKMLVMIDNRTVYNQLYSGVFWDTADVLLEDVERIEVVRGPGATLWGANAVNGVINIVTRKAGDTHGAMVLAEAGRVDQEGAVRYGGHWGPSADYRIYTKYLHRSPLLAQDGSSSEDWGSSERAGARLDWRESARDLLTFQGDLYRDAEQQRVDFDYASTAFTLNPVRNAGGFAEARWDRQRSSSSDMTAQAYYSEDRRSEISNLVHMRSFDLDLQDHRPLGGRNDFVWGAGYRWTSDSTGGAQPMFLHPDHVGELFSAFAQDEMTLLPGKLVLTAGTKLLWNTYSHFEYQPSGRLLWKPSPTQSLWASVSRAVRTPSDLDRDVRLDFSDGVVKHLPLEVQITGNPRFGSEILRAYEGGYRQQMNKAFSVDLAGFVNHYSSLGATLISAPRVVPGPAPTLVEASTYVNGLSSNAQGAEAALTWTPVAAVQVQGSYTWMQNRFDNHGNTAELPLNNEDWTTPRNGFDVRGFWSPAPKWSVGAILNGNSAAAAALGTVIANPSAYLIPGHTRLDLRLARKIGENMSLSAGGTNLLQHDHMEFHSDYAVHSQIPRSAWIRLAWTH
jgi:iron complex outermembrane receptor protein